MKKTRRLGCSLLLCLIFFGVIIYSIDNHATANTILPGEYHFIINGQPRKAGTEFELKSNEFILGVSAEGWAPETEVQWISSEPGVVIIENTNLGNNFVKLVRKGPGFSTITAVVKYNNTTYSLSCSVKVNLEINHVKTGTIELDTTKVRYLRLDTIDLEKQIYLKYLNYTPDGQDTEVDGDDVAASALLWESEDESVVTVDDKGKVKAIGSGSTNIVITTNTMSSQDKALKVTLRVVVKPSFDLTFGGNTYYSINPPSVPVPVTEVPSNFIINSQATKATNLKWVIREVRGTTRTEIKQNDTSRMSYSISGLSGNVSFQNVKAGTYEILAFADKAFNEDTNVPHAYMIVIVPIRLDNQHIVMNVKNNYKLIENSNIPSADIFNVQYIVGNQNIASIENGVITANSKGTVTIRLTYIPSKNLYDNGFIVVDPIDLHITVIDGISLSMTSAKLYTSATLMLVADVTDYTQPIVWSSSDPKIATVADGRVTGIKPGIVTITASQTINGVIKSATCEITIQQSVASVKLDPANVTLAINDYKTLLATITPSNLSGVTLTWRSSNDKVVKIVETGNLTTTIQGVAGGTAVISAINQDNVVVGYSHITVQQSVTSIVLSETNVTVDLAMKSLQLRATVNPENAVNKKVNWKSSDTTKARVNESGLVTFLKPGTVSIIATSDDNPKISAICNFNIKIPVVSVALDETTKTMYAGQVARLSYVVLPTNASTNAVTWISTNPNVATVDATGRVTAKNVGTTVIILRSLDGGHSVYCTISVKRVASGIKFEANEINLKSGEYYYINYNLTPKDSTDTEIVWESTDTKVATVDTKGKVVAKNAGTAIIMARTEAGAVAYCKVNVSLPVKGVILNFTEKTLYVKERFELRASVNPSTASNLGVTWSSSNTKVATVSKNGTVEGLTGGTAIITATTNEGGYTAICVVTVREPVTTIKLNRTSYNVGIGKSYTLIATVTTPTATNTKVRWVSSNPKVATVNQSGRVTGVALGRATITAIAQDGSKVEASCDIRVVRPVTSVTVDKSYLSLLVGQNSKLKVTVKPNNATIRSVTWKSSDETVAIVDNDGVVTALKAGNATITATANDNSGKKSITYVLVRDRVPATGIIAVDKKLTMVSGETKTVQVVLNPATSTDGFTWSTDNSAVARVDKKTGKITARGVGKANITVMTDSGKTAVVEVTVVGLNITELELEQYTNYPYPLQVEGATTRVIWSIDKPEVATVINGRVSTRAVGKATITATVNGRRLTCKLTVTKIK